MWDLLIGAVICAPPALLLGREAVAEAVFAAWMRRGDPPTSRALPVAHPVTRAEVAGWSGVVVDGELAA